MDDQRSKTALESPNDNGAKVSRREFLRLAALSTGSAAFASIIAACATPAPGPAAPAALAVVKPKLGGKVTWGLEQDPTTLLPYGAVATANQWGKEYMYESLVEWNKDLIVQPALAEKWTTPDDKTWIWNLRKGVKFHNGDEVTAEDVKYSLDLQADPPKPGIKIAQYPSIVSTDVVDKYTVKFTMKGPDPTVLGYLAWQRYSAIIPKGMYDKINPAVAGIGTGPYKLVEYVQNDRVVYAKNKDYWKPNYPYVEDRKSVV